MISVIVPIYNIEAYVGTCIESIISQSCQELEIILVDDGATDSSGRICDEYAQRDGRIKVIHKKNGGLVSARKAGLEMAQGEYISYVDGDDWIEAGMYESLLNMSADADIIAFAGYEEYGEGAVRGFKKNTVREGLYITEAERHELYKKMLYNGNFFESGVLVYVWAKLIKRELLMECQMKVPDSVSYAEDAACTYPCLLKARSVYISNMPFYHYRVRPGSMVKTAIGLDKLAALFQTLKGSFSGHLLEEELHRQVEYFMRHAILLKRYTQVGLDMVLYPFEKVKTGMRVAIYGAGMFGKNVWEYCNASDDIVEAGWFDKRYDIYVEQGLCVQPASHIYEAEFDMVVIAIVNEKMSEQIKSDFVWKGIEPEKIDCISLAVLKRGPLPEMLSWGRPI